MNADYRHTQVGWVILGVAAAVVAFVWAGLPPEVTVAARVPLLLVAALVVLVFGTLTVEVDQEAIRLRFGIGLVRKRIPLRDVQGWREFRNPWYSGWGIHLGPGGVLWNVSGLDAVQLGARRREALPHRHGRAGRARVRDHAGEGRGPGRRRDVRQPRVSGGSRVLEGSGSRCWPWESPWWERSSGPRSGRRRSPWPREGFEVKTLFYGASFAAADITAVSLETKLPRVLLKTNGFGGAGTLRGHFRVEGLGEGRLYVEEGFAPYVLVRLRRGLRDRELPRAGADAGPLRRDGARLARPGGSARPS